MLAPSKLPFSAGVTWGTLGIYLVRRSFGCDIAQDENSPLHREVRPHRLPVGAQNDEIGHLHNMLMTGLAQQRKRGELVGG